MSKFYNCIICNKEHIFGSRLKDHLTIHNITVDEYHWKHILGLDSHPRCKICGKLVYVQNISDNYPKYCSIDCNNKDPFHGELLKELQLNKEFVKSRLFSRIDKNSIGYIYIAKYEDCIKVGFSTNIKNRKKNLYTKDIIYWSNTSEICLNIELNIHNIFKNFRVESKLSKLECYNLSIFNKIVDYINSNI